MIALINKMITKAHNALDNAYAPYSKFKVACCIQTSNGTLFTGVNVENGSYGLTLCAEAAAISNMVSAGEQHISHMVVLASSNMICPPCGACRQRIHEFSDENTMIHMCDRENVLVSSSIVELLLSLLNLTLNRM